MLKQVWCWGLCVRDGPPGCSPWCNRGKEGAEVQGLPPTTCTSTFTHTHTHTHTHAHTRTHTHTHATGFMLRKDEWLLQILTSPPRPQNLTSDGAPAVEVDKAGPCIDACTCFVFRLMHGCTAWLQLARARAQGAHSAALRGAAQESAHKGSWQRSYPAAAHRLPWRAWRPPRPLRSGWWRSGPRSTTHLGL
jgi:hypothetical protein